jgi:hypothetical protein
LVLSCAGVADAAINIAHNKPIIGGSGDYPNGPFNSGAFPAYSVTDGFGATPDNDVGQIWEYNGIGYWLGTAGPSTGYFVLDLGTPYNIGLIELFNTHNGPYQDRGTGDFKITASNSIVDMGGSNFDLVSPVQIASGTLAPQTDGVYLVPSAYTASSAGPFRYLRFDALSIGAHGTYGFNGVGLNEMRVFEALAAVPEPGVSLIFALVGGIGCLMRRHLHKFLG